MTLHILPDLEQGTLTRFWRFVRRAEPGQCWEWTGYRQPNHYGKFWLNGGTRAAHRLSYEIHKGAIPAGAVVRHSCDNKACVNPAHLLIGTGRDNVRDAVERGRVLRGADNGRAKLTDEQVIEIKNCWARGETQVSMARRFGVSRAAIQWVLNGKNWAHLEDAS